MKLALGVSREGCDPQADRRVEKRLGGAGELLSSWTIKKCVRTPRSQLGGQEGKGRR